MPASPELYPDSPPLTLRCVALDSQRQAGTTDFRDPPDWSVDKTDLLSIVEADPNGLWIKVKARHSGRVDKQLVTVSVRTSAPGNSSFEIYVCSRPPAAIAEIVVG